MTATPAKPWTDPTEWRDELDDLRRMLADAGRTGPLRDEIAILLVQAELLRIRLRQERADATADLRSAKGHLIAAAAWAAVPDEYVPDDDLDLDAVIRRMASDLEAAVKPSAAYAAGVSAGLADVIRLTGDMWDEADQATLGYVRGWCQGRKEGLQ